jgi:amino acid transporter
MGGLMFFNSAQAISGMPCLPGLRCPGPGENTINGLIITVIGLLLSVAFGLAVLFLIIGGFRYITSAGNEESAEAGRKTVINAIIGIIIIVLSYVIINVVSNTVAGAGVGN